MRPRVNEHTPACTGRGANACADAVAIAPMCPICALEGVRSSLTIIKTVRDRARAYGTSRGFIGYYGPTETRYTFACERGHVISAEGIS